MNIAKNSKANETKYEAFSRFLLQQIQAGVYKPGEKLPSERAMAQKYNIAHMTINKALNGLVSSGYLERRPPVGTFVLEPQTRLKSAVVVMDYRATHAILPQPLQHAMADSGYVVTMFDLYNLTKQPDFFLEFCKQQQPDLLLIEGYSIFPFELLDQLPEIPTIFLNRMEHVYRPNASYILSDVEQAGRLAAQLLVENGCCNIGILMGKPDNEFHSDHLLHKSMAAYLAEAGFPEPLTIEPEAHTIENFSRLLAEKRCDGYLGALDSYLLPIEKLLRKQNVPDEQRPLLIGKGNTPWAESFEFTSLDIQPMKFTSKICEVIAEMPKPQTVKIPVVPVFRKSCPQVGNQALHT